MIVPDDTAPDDIVPDDKDWTWVLEQACPECGYDASALDTASMGEQLRSNARVWVGVIAGGDASLAQRPSAQRWSTLEYACHVRDVFRLFDTRLQLMLANDGARFENWNQDETAARERYAEQEPLVVAEELLAAGDALAERFGSVEGQQWQRTGLRSDGASFTVDSFARYLMHDPVHHLWDIGAST